MLIDDIRFIERNYSSLLDVPIFNEPWQRIKALIETQNTAHNNARDEILLCEDTNHCTFKVWSFDLDKYLCGCKQRKTLPVV
jgi:hypothetical protein